MPWNKIKLLSAISFFYITFLFNHHLNASWIKNNCFEKYNKICNLMESHDHIYDQILNHNFNAELSKGVLSEDIFREFIIQDIFYIKKMSKVWEIIAENVPQEYKSFCLERAKLEYQEAERLENHYNVKYDNDFIPHHQNYLDHLYISAKNGALEGIIALLPCYTNFSRLGNDLMSKVDKNNPYHDYISSQMGGTISSLRNKLMEMAHLLLDKNDKYDIHKLSLIYKSSMMGEFNFFNDLYKKSLR